MSNAHAKLISASLEIVQQSLSLRRLAESRYDVRCPEKYKMPKRDVVWVYDLRVPGMDSNTQTALVRELRRSEIEARHGFKPMSTQEEYRGCKVLGIGRAEVLSREVIYLPVMNRLGSPIGPNEADHAFEIIQTVLKT